VGHILARRLVVLAQRTQNMWNFFWFIWVYYYAKRDRKKRGIASLLFAIELIGAL
jgi:hypothetical protein